MPRKNVWIPDSMYAKWQAYGRPGGGLSALLQGAIAEELMTVEYQADLEMVEYLRLQADVADEPKRAHPKRATPM